MVSTYNRKVDIKNEIIDIMEYRGLSTDIKPLLNEGVGNGSMFIEIDTGNIYLFSQEDNTWYKIGGSGGGGADLNDYFTNTFTNTNVGFPEWTNMVKKVPEPVIVNGTSMSYAFATCNYIPQFTITNASTIQTWNQCFALCKDTRKIDLSNIQFASNCTKFENMFASSYFDEIDMSSLGTLTITLVAFLQMFAGAKARKINLSNLTLANSGQHTTSQMFYNCTNLEELDISKFDFSKVESYNNMFTGVPDNCLIYVKDQNQVDWFTTNFPSLTNVQIKGE